MQIDYDTGSITCKKTNKHVFSLDLTANLQFKNVANTYFREIYKGLIFLFVSFLGPKTIVCYCEIKVAQDPRLYTQYCQIQQSVDEMHKSG